MFNRILIIGVGGTGSFLVPALCRYLRSIKFDGHIIIADGDTYSYSNLDRQLFSSSAESLNKAEYQAGVILNHMPDLENQVRYLDRFLSEEDFNNPDIIDDNTIVINCVDNKAARTFVERRLLSHEINTMAHVCCGNTDRTGQVQLSFKRNGRMITPSIFERYPELNSVEDDVSGLSCEELAKLPSGGQIIAANMMASSFALNYIVQLFDERFPVCKGQFIPHACVEFDILTNTVGSHQKSTNLFNIMQEAVCQ